MIDDQQIGTQDPASRSDVAVTTNAIVGYANAPSWVRTFLCFSPISDVFPTLSCLIPAGRGIETGH